MSKIGKKLGIPTPIREFAPDSSWKLPHQMMGIEIEVENCRGNGAKALFDYWADKEDGSLRLHGREWVTQEGYFGKDLRDAISCFYTYKGKTWRSSFRTGLHVHMDMRGNEIADLARLCVIYSLTEKLLFAWVGDERENNINCLPWHKAQADLPLIAELLSEDTNDDRYSRVAQRISRYSALNLAALRKFGTIEFRHMRTTLDENRLIMWINLLMCLKHSAMTTCKNQSLQEIAESAYKSPVKFGSSIFQEYWNEVASLIDPVYAIKGCMISAIDIVEAFAVKNQPIPIQEWTDFITSAIPHL